MNRKLLSIIVIVALLLASVIVLVACNKQAEQHVCQFVKKDTVKPTCMDEGYTRYVCESCNKEIRRDIVAVDPENHLWVAYTTVDSECTKTEEGNTVVTYAYTINQCQHCKGYRFDVDTKANHEHDWDEGVVVKNDCNGRVVGYTCTTCDVYEEKIVKNDAYHVCEDASSEKILPTYLNSGYTIFDCPCHRNFVNDYVAPKSADYLTFEKFNDYKFGQGNEAYSVKGKTYISDVNVIVPYEYMGINVTKIATSAFQHATKVKTITLTTNIKYIGDLAFYNAAKLEKIVFMGTIKDWKTLVANSGSNFYPSHWDKSVVPEDFNDAMHNDYFYIECSDGRLYLDGKTMVLFDANIGEYVQFIPADITVTNK